MYTRTTQAQPNLPDCAAPTSAQSVHATRSFVRQVSLYAAVMNACYTVGDMDAILSLGDQLRAQTLTPDHTAYHLMVTSHISKLVSTGSHACREPVNLCRPFFWSRRSAKDTVGAGDGRGSSESEALSWYKKHQRVAQSRDGDRNRSTTKGLTKYSACVRRGWLIFSLAGVIYVPPDVVFVVHADGNRCVLVWSPIETGRIWINPCSMRGRLSDHSSPIIGRPKGSTLECPD